MLAAAVGVLGSPLRKYASGPQVELFACLALIIALFLSWRFRSLRGFLAASALLVLLAESLLLPPHTALAADGLMALTLTLILLVDDHFFDWRATAYWAGLLFLQSALLLGVIRSSQGFADSSTTEVFVAMGAVAIAIAALRHREPILSGLFWILLCLALASRFGWQGAFVATTAVVLVIALLERAYRLAYHDELTGLSGRRAFNAAIGELSEHYCIAMVDVDHFKSFNDTFGHDTGDQVLRKVAARLGEVRAGGTAFRCGGEEFAIVFPACDLNDALAEAEELRRRIERDVFVVRGPDRSHRKRSERRAASRRARRRQSFATNVTVSIGVADCTRTNDPEQVVALADRALYVAKNSGRNRVEAVPAVELVALKHKAGKKLPTVGIAR